MGNESPRDRNNIPGPSVQEILNRETRPVPSMLRESRNDYFGDPAGARIEVERYFSPEFSRLEAQRMWSRTWQLACRVEEVPNVGDHVVYEVLDKSLIVMRSSPGEIKAFHNVCLLGAESSARPEATSRISDASSTASPGASTASSARSRADGIFRISKTKSARCPRPG